MILVLLFLFLGKGRGFLVNLVDFLVLLLCCVRKECCLPREYVLMVSWDLVPSSGRSLSRVSVLELVERIMNYELHSLWNPSLVGQIFKLLGSK